LRPDGGPLGTLVAVFVGSGLAAEKSHTFATIRTLSGLSCQCKLK